MDYNYEITSEYGSMASLATLVQSDSVSEHGSVSALSDCGSLSMLHQPDNLSFASLKMDCNYKITSEYGSMASLATLVQSDSVSEHGSVSALSDYGSLSMLHQPDNLSFASLREPKSLVPLKYPEKKESFARKQVEEPFAFMALNTIEEIPEDDKFDWMDERKKKDDKTLEEQAHNFSPLMAFCEFLAESREVDEERAREDACMEQEKSVRIENKIKIDEMRRQKEKQDKIDMDKIMYFYHSAEVVNPMKERRLNQEKIDSFQENLIEWEEDVPAYKNMPQEKYQKAEKARRVQKEPVEGETIVDCPFCNHK
jgi:hypothetical protein